MSEQIQNISDEFLEVYKNANYNQAVVKNSEGTDVLTVAVTNLLT